MTQLRSWPMVGVDRKNVEHFYEQQAYTMGQAGRDLAKNHGNLIRAYIECSKLPRGTPSTPRKLVWCLKGYEEEVNGFGVMAEAMSQGSLNVAEMLIKGWRKRGIRLEIDEQEGNTDVFITPKGVATDADRRDIEENRESLIAYIKQRNLVEAEANASAADDDTTEEDKVSFRETIRRILPDLPKDFGVSDVQNQLRSWRHDDLAADKKCLHNLLHWVVQEGYAKRGARGRYILVDEKVFARQPPTTKPDVADTIKPPPPESVKEVPQAPAQLSLVAPPAAHPALAPQPVPPPAPIVPMAPAPAMASSLLPGSPPAQDALIRFVTELAAGQISEPTISEAEKAINVILGAWETVTNAIAPIEGLIRRARQINANKSQLLQTFAGVE